MSIPGIFSGFTKILRRPVENLRCLICCQQWIGGKHQRQCAGNHGTGHAGSGFHFISPGNRTENIASRCRHIDPGSAVAVTGCKGDKIILRLHRRNGNGSFIGRRIHQNRGRRIACSADNRNTCIQGLINGSQQQFIFYKGAAQTQVDDVRAPFHSQINCRGNPAAFSTTLCAGTLQGFDGQNAAFRCNAGAAELVLSGADHTRHMGAMAQIILAALIFLREHGKFPIVIIRNCSFRSGNGLCQIFMIHIYTGVDHRYQDTPSGRDFPCFIGMQNRKMPLVQAVVRLFPGFLCLFNIVIILRIERHPFTGCPRPNPIRVRKAKGSDAILVADQMGTHAVCNLLGMGGILCKECKHFCFFQLFIEIRSCCKPQHTM